MDIRPIPYPADTRAKGWRFEVDTEAIKASDTWLRAKTGAMRGALLLLWSEAWQRTPCGTLPNDDELVALLIDMPLVAFTKNRAVLMRGWSLADDGLLYHDTITKRVLSMLDKRANDAQRAATRRARKADCDASHAEVTRDTPVTHTGVRPEFDTKHQAPVIPSTVVNPPKPPRKRRGTASQDELVPVEQLVADGVAPQVAADWLAIRKVKTLPLTPTAWQDTQAEAANAGLSIDDAIRYSVVRSRGGFRASWIQTDDTGQPMRTTGPPNKQEALEERNRAAGRKWADNLKKELESTNAAE